MVGDGRAPPHLVGQVPLGDEASGPGNQGNERVNLPISRKNLFASPKETTTVRIELEWTETINPGPNMHVGAPIIASGAHARRRTGSKIMQACTKKLEWDRKKPERSDCAEPALIICRIGAATNRSREVTARKNRLFANMTRSAPRIGRL